MFEGGKKQGQKEGRGNVVNKRGKITCTERGRGKFAFYWE